MSAPVIPWPPMVKREISNQVLLLQQSLTALVNQVFNRLYRLKHLIG